MRRWRKVLDLLRSPHAPAAMFSNGDETEPRPIDQVILDMTGRGAVPRVSRAEALTVPAVVRGRNMICSVATLPLVEQTREFRAVRNPLLEQLDPNVANVVTLAQTLEDLLFESISWWRITAFGQDLMPFSVMHLDYGSVSVDPPKDRSPAPLPSGIDPREGVVYVDGETVPGSEIIRFDSPNPAVLKVAGRAIRRAVLLDVAAGVYADDPRPLDFFSPHEGADPASDTEIEKLLTKWAESRKKRKTGYVPAALKYNPVDTPSPADLQLVELQQKASLDLANELGIDPEDLGVSTTSRTYANAVDRRRDRINDVLAPYMKAITDRLSMPDVTKRGNTVNWVLDDYLKSNPTERWNTHKIAKEIGVKSAEEIRAEERMTPGAPEPKPAPTPAPPPVPASALPAAENKAPAGATFDADENLQFADLPMHSFRVDRERRMIHGDAMPYGQVVSKLGLKIRFLRNSLVWNQRAPGRVKLLRDHDMTNPLGFAKSLANAGDLFRTSFKVGRGAEGDRALELAEDGILDGMSVGVDFDLSTDVEMDDDGVMNVRRATLREVSLTAMPAFDDARVTKVAASRSEGTSGMDPCQKCGQTHAAGVVDCPTPPEPSANQQAANAALALNADQISALLAHPGALQALVRPAAPAAPATPPGALTLSREQLDAIIAGGGLGALLGMPQLTPAPSSAPEPRPTVDPTRNRAPAATKVEEPMPYRFDRDGNLTKGATYDFSTDLFHGSKGDTEALERAQSFMRLQFDHIYAEFDVDKADAAALNPNRQRPDMYVDQREFTYPIWDAINKGTIEDATPFVLPKFNTATGLVAAHAEGVEPTPGTFTATSQTITPSAVSGKVEITREAWDQGGNPQLSGIIWRQMTRAWFEALEASAVALLDGLTPTGITFTTGGGTTGQTLDAEITAALAALQYVRGGFRMRDLFLQIDLYKALVAAQDNDKRRLYPLLNPVNASGQVSDFFADIMVGGLRGRPAWALAATGAVAASSYLFDRTDVHGWATAPQRLEFQYRVSYVDVAIWGYKATANTDITGVRELIYDPVV
jgi:HK97 family phage prohead protease